MYGIRSKSLLATDTSRKGDEHILKLILQWKYEKKEGGEEAGWGKSAKTLKPAYCETSLKSLIVVAHHLCI